MRVAAVVIWFNPTIKLANNIASYSKYLDKIIIVDNSMVNNSKMLYYDLDVEYIPLNKNVGIAAALNVGCQRASNLAMEWVLTMDQDSWFDEEAILRYLDPQGAHFKEDGVAIFAPSLAKIPNEGFSECKSVITSGSLVKLAAYQAMSGYDEKLFIDQVDHEFCYRLKKNGYRIVRLNEISMNHTIGDPIHKKLFWFNIVSSNHNYIRRYYMTRNRLYMWRHYAEFGTPYLKMIFIDIATILLLENDKRRKLRYMIKGTIDYLFNRMGAA